MQRNLNYVMDYYINWVLLSVDVLFDVFYAFFPIIIIIGGNEDGSDSSFLVSLASLETDNPLSIRSNLLIMCIYPTSHI